MDNDDDDDGRVQNQEDNDVVEYRVDGANMQTNVDGGTSLDADDSKEKVKDKKKKLKSIVSLEKIPTPVKKEKLKSVVNTDKIPKLDKDKLKDLSKEKIPKLDKGKMQAVVNTDKLPTVGKDKLKAVVNTDKLPTLGKAKLKDVSIQV